MPEQYLYLVKANDDVISHCKCALAPMGWPAQMDCPWCGCGWLFICNRCGKPFTFARAELIDQPIESIAHRDLMRTRGEEPSAAEIAEWVQVMRILQKGIEAGKTYVYLDGFCFPTDSEAISFDGWEAHHDLAHPPHLAALKDLKVLDRTIGRRGYWEERAIDYDDE